MYGDEKRRWFWWCQQGTDTFAILIVLKVNAFPAVLRTKRDPAIGWKGRNVSNKECIGTISLCTMPCVLCSVHCECTVHWNNSTVHCVQCTVHFIATINCAWTFHCNNSTALWMCKYCAAQSVPNAMHCNAQLWQALHNGIWFSSWPGCLLQLKAFYHHCHFVMALCIIIFCTDSIFQNKLFVSYLLFSLGLTAANLKGARRA